MRKFLPVVFTLTALAAAAAASAAEPATAPSDHAAKGAEWRQQFFDKLDTNHDGTISRAEYQSWVDSRFAKLDSNGDGTVDANEVATSQAAAERVQKRAEGFVRRYDPSGDGQVTKADFEAKEMQRFDRLSDGADSITEEQLAAARPFKHRRGAPTSADNGG
jgi:hypothetical protein